MKKKILLIVILLFSPLLLIIPSGLQNYLKEGKNRACFENHCFNLELASTPKERDRGLMFRETLDSGKGMLFIFEKEGNHAFWMKNTLIPLDIIWLNKDKEVVFISENAQPCKEDSCSLIEPGKETKYVLEINGGISKRIGLAVGHKMEIEYLRQ